MVTLRRSFLGLLSLALLIFMFLPFSMVAMAAEESSTQSVVISPPEQAEVTAGTEESLPTQTGGLMLVAEEYPGMSVDPLPLDKVAPDVMGSCGDPCNGNFDCSRFCMTCVPSLAVAVSGSLGLSPKFGVCA